jgi:hypothetical protein
LRFTENIFDLPTMTGRDQRADPLAGALDFTKPPRLEPMVLHTRDDCSSQF